MAAVQRVEYVTSQAGGQQVLHEGYRYLLNVRGQVATPWKGVQSGCNRYCSTVGDHLRAVTEHNHPPVRSSVASYESTETIFLQ